jgi:dTDP-4-dehydrorhamnose 3,5-epimerase
MSQVVKLIKPMRFGDDRGWFTEVYSEKAFANHGINLRFVQDNHSLSVYTGTIRGIHFQSMPHAQAKLVRCIAGRIMDYAVDLRRGSPTYGHYVGVELSAASGLQLFVPVGFGHAFVTLEPNTEVTYKVTDVYAPDCDGGILWSDPTVGIDWPLPETGAVLSGKDRKLPTLEAFDSPFDYVGPPLEPFEGVISGRESKS